MITLDESSARHRDLDLTTHNTHKKQASMPPAGFETTILARELTPTHPLNRAVPESAYCTNSQAYYDKYGFPRNCIKKVALCYQRKF
jgi:hypothetical protein